MSAPRSFSPIDASSGAPTLQAGSGSKKGSVPLWRWLLWSICLALAIPLFYVVLTPVWMGLRALAWLADFRARRRPGYRPPVRPS